LTETAGNGSPEEVRPAEASEVPPEAEHASAPETPPPTPPKPVKSATREIIETLLITVVIALLLRHFVLTVNEIKGSSMEPTLYTAERVITLKFLYWFHPPRRGDVIVLANPFPEGKDDFIKRVIGVPGDTVEMRKGQVYVNEKPINEPYANRGDDSFGPRQVPPGQVFVLGDNRPKSVDSRWFGYVSIKNVDGRAVLLYWPLSQWKAL